MARAKGALWPRVDRAVAGLCAGLSGPLLDQIAALERAIRAPDSTFTARGHSRTHHVSGETARHDLMDLEQRGLLTRFKIGRQFAWSPVSDLPDRLLG